MDAKDIISIALFSLSCFASYCSHCLSVTFSASCSVVLVHAHSTQLSITIKFRSFLYSFIFWDFPAGSKGSEMIRGEDFKALFVEETKFYNRIVLGPILPSAVWDPLPHFLQTWLRNYIAAILVYFVSGLAWSFVIYYWKRNLYVPKGPSFLYICFFGTIFVTLVLMGCPLNFN